MSFEQLTCLTQYALKCCCMRKRAGLQYSYLSYAWPSIIVSISYCHNCLNDFRVDMVGKDDSLWYQQYKWHMCGDPPAMGTCYGTRSGHCTSVCQHHLAQTPHCVTLQQYKSLTCWWITQPVRLYRNPSSTHVYTYIYSCMIIGMTEVA